MIETPKTNIHTPKFGGERTIEQVRRDFPILQTQAHGKPLVYLDNAATTQKPRCVIEALTHFYTSENATVHRGLYALTQQATERYEAARDQVRSFIGAAASCEIIFTRGATEAINLVAHSFGRARLKRGDEILITQQEHHSNIVPWQLVCAEKKINLRVVPVTKTGELIMEEFDRLLNERTRMVAVTHVSNALGAVNPVREMCAKAHAQGAVALVDGAQSVPHLPVNVDDLGADFFVFSGHKMYGPTGIGVLYGRAEWLEQMRPYQSGGDMVSSVSFDKTVFAKIPFKFEAGTPPVADAIGLGAAVAYLNALGMDAIRAHEHDLLGYALDALRRVDGLRILGPARDQAGIVSFTLECAHPHDIAQLLDGQGIAIRSGHHCAQPLMQFLGVPATARVSFGLYNMREDIDALVRALHSVKEVFA